MPQIVDTLSLCIALIPLAVYFLAIGLVNLIGRPWIISGAKDTAALGLGISGFVFAGPMQLFVPSASVFKLGAYVWPLLIAFYLMSLTLVILLRRPRLVIYNVGPQQLRPVLAQVISGLDPAARWAGDCLFLPTLGVQLQMEYVSLVRNVQLVATAGAQSFEGWLRLERALRPQLRDQTGSRNLFGFSLLVAGLMLAIGVAIWAVHDAATVAQSLRDMLHVPE